MNVETYLKVYDQYYKLAYKIVYDILRDPDAVNDVLQDLFTEMFEKHEGLDETQVKYWILLNANRRTLDYKKKGYRKYEMAVDDIHSRGHAEKVLAACGHQPEEHLIRQEWISYCKRALEDLRSYKPKWHEILMDYHIRGHDYSRIAKKYDTSAAYIRVETSRARKWLKKRVKELYRSD